MHAVNFDIKSKFSHLFAAYPQFIPKQHNNIFLRISNLFADRLQTFTLHLLFISQLSLAEPFLEQLLSD